MRPSKAQGQLNPKARGVKMGWPVARVFMGWIDHSLTHVKIGLARPDP